MQPKPLSASLTSSRSVTPPTGQQSALLTSQASSLPWQLHVPRKLSLCDTESTSMVLVGWLESKPVRHPLVSSENHEVTESCTPASIRHDVSSMIEKHGHVPITDSGCSVCLNPCSFNTNHRPAPCPCCRFRDSSAWVMLLGPLTLFLGLERADTVKASASAGFHTPTMTPWFMTGELAQTLTLSPCVQLVAPPPSLWPASSSNRGFPSLHCTCLG